MIANQIESTNRFSNHPDLFVSHMRRTNRSRKSGKSLLLLGTLAMMCFAAWLCFSSYSNTVRCAGSFAPDYFPNAGYAKLQQKIHSPLSSKIESIKVSEGADFKKGELLATLSVEDLHDSINMQKKIVAVAINKILMQRNAPDHDYDQLHLAEIALEKLLAQFEQRFIVAPYNGIVVEANATQGEWVNKGQAILEIAPQSKTLLFLAEVKSREIHKIAVGGEVKIMPETFDRLTDEPLIGRVRQIPQSTKTMDRIDVEERPRIYTVTVKMDSTIDNRLIRSGVKGECYIYPSSEQDNSRLNVTLNHFARLMN